MIPVILSGGSGSRLWPVSKAENPKPYCDIFSPSLIQQTISRLQPFGAVHIVSLKSMKHLTELALKSTNEDIDQAISEPEGRNTAPAVALLCKYLLEKGRQEEVVGVFPADHFIEDQEAFTAALKLAIECAQQNKLATLGIIPTRPETGYGYIESIKDKPFLTVGQSSAYPVKQFLEKPDRKKAETFVASGHHFWNAGIFIFKVKVMIAAMEKLLPEVWNPLAQVSVLDEGTLQSVYATLPKISLDYGIMEKVDEQVCIPVQMGWSDVGSWDEVAQLKGDALGNAATFEAKGAANFVYAQKEKNYAFVGVKDLIVVDAPDSLLIVKKGESQSVREMGERVEGLESGQDSKGPFFEERPWGRYEVLDRNPDFQVKKITVEPNSQLSYQSHKLRGEHWVVVKGTGEVILNDKVLPVTQNSHVFIECEAKHRMRNTSGHPLVFVEIQTGQEFIEKDIIRYEDDYGR